MTYVSPKNLSEAIEELDGRNWTVLAGGTDIFPATDEHALTGNVLDISHIKELREIAYRDDCWSIGALATWSDIQERELPLAFNALQLAAKEVGSIQIQNRATIAGNICNASPAADGVPPLLVLNGSVEALSATGTRRVPLAEFILDNRKIALKKDELVTRILVPGEATKGYSAFFKLGSRKYLVISISMVAVRIETDDQGYITEAAVAVGACSAVAKRLIALERVLLGKNVTEDVSGLVTLGHLASLTPMDDVRAKSDYRSDATLTMVRRALSEVGKRLQK